jgi:hypothetical protein
MSPTRSEYKELGLELVSIEDKRSHTPKRPLMVREKKDDGTGDPFKLLIEESLTQQRNEMMDSFTQILRWLPTGDTSSSNGGTTPFKVQINFDIPIFEGKIDAYVVDKWLNLLEGYFYVHNFSNRENITFALLKVVPHVKDWWETLCEQKKIEEPSLFSITTTWESFRDVIKEQYYLVGSYDDLYTKWTTLWQERDQAVLDFTNIFHTLCTKLGIKDSEQHMVLKYRCSLHRYIQTEMEFLDISSLGAAYQYVVKIEQKLKQKTRQFGPRNPSQQKTRKGGPNPQNKGQSKDGQYHYNQSKLQAKKDTRKTKKDTRKWCDFHKSPWHNTTDCRSKQSLVAEVKASKSDADSNSESEPEMGRRIIDVEPSATVATTKLQPSEPDEPEEGESLFYSQMWVKGTPLHFIVDSSIQKNLISAEVVKRLALPTTLHPQPYTIGWLHQGSDLRVSQQC